MKLSVRLILLLATLVLAISPAFAVVCVKTDGSDSNSGADWNFAKKTITAGLNAAASGDEVWVAAGTYTEAVTLRSTIKLYGGFAGTEIDKSERNWKTNRTIITTLAGDVVTGATGAVIDGFVIRGGAVCIRCTNSSPEINSNLIMLGTSSGIANTGSPVITNNIIVANASYGVLSSAGNPKIINNTLVGNGYGVNLTTGGSPVISNNIIAFNTYGISKSAGSPSLSCNDVYGNRNGNYSSISAGTGDISLDPQFASFNYGDLHIQPTSPCRNAVTVVVPGAPAVDMDNQSRSQGANPDMGADESYDETYNISAREIYVNWAVASSGDGTSWATAYKTIQEAVDSTLTKGGAVVKVAKGTYQEQVKLRPFTHIYGGFSADASPSGITSIDAGNTTTSGNNAITACNLSTISGFTLRGGYCGIYCSYASPTISNNIITLNGTYGIWCRDISYPVIEVNRISSNGTYGIHINATSPIVTNNIIVGHTYGIDVTNASSPAINNNTIVGNGTGINCTATGSAGSLILANNIIAYNSTGVNRGGTSTLPTFYNNDVYSNNVADYNPASTITMPRLTDLSVDPQFASIDYGNFHIKAASLCRDAGTSSVAGVPARDMDGDIRPEGSVIDIGADESYGQEYTNDDHRIVYVKGSAVSGGNGSDWNQAYRTIQAGVDDTLSKGGAEIRVATGTYVESVSLRPYARLYGGYAGTGVNDATRDVSQYVTTVDPGESKPVINGATYATIDGFTIKGGSYGVFCSYSSPTISNNIITGSTTNGIYCGNSSSPVITLNKLSATGTAGIYILSGSPTIEKNTVSDNSAGSGIVFAPSTSGTVSRNTISGNNIGISSDTSSSPKITSNLIIGNALQAVSCSSSAAVVTNNTIAANGTGVLSVSSPSLKLYNNIIASNSTGISVSSSAPTIVKNDVNGNTINYSGIAAPAGNLNVDPQFASLDYGNFHIQPTSPCRDAGDPAAPNLPSLDIEDQVRPQAGTAIDIGADESYNEPYANPYEPRTIYVNQAATAGGDGATWNTAYRTIKEALDDTLAHGGAQIWVAQGAYTELIKLRQFTHLFGGFSGMGTETLLSQRNYIANVTTIQSASSGSGNVVTGSGLSTIDGFTITKGNYGIDCTSSSPKILNNMIKGNNNGINCSNSFPVITANTISGNTTTGVNCSNSSPTITGNAISGSIKGIYCTSSSPIITGNTISANSTYGIDCQIASAPKVINNLLSVNATAINCVSSSPALTNNTIVCSADIHNPTIGSRIIFKVKFRKIGSCRIPCVVAE